MGKKGYNGDEEEVVILLDEDGNEIFMEEDLEEPAERYTEDMTVVLDDVKRKLDDSEIELEEEYELEDTEFEDEEYEDEESTSFFANASNKIIAVFGGLIAIAAIVIGIVFIISRAGGNDTVDFSNVGKNVAELGVIGESKILDIAAAKGADIDELNEAIANFEYDEIDEETGVIPVTVTLTTILKDLKIKFVNPKDKLIASVPFEVEVTDPSGNVTKWIDTDKDGIIYQTDLAGGTYQVKLISMAGYDAYYDFSSPIQSLAVKTQLDYQKVDVKNEIKKSSQVAETEDVTKKETEVESKLKDTVAYVMSNRVSTSGFTPISKDTIADPLAALITKNEASLFRFKRLSGPINTAELNGGVSGGDPHEHNYVYTPNGDGKHKVECSLCTDTFEDGTCDTNGEGGKCSKCGYKAECAHDYVYTPNNNGTHKVTCKNCTETFPDEKCDTNGTEGACSKCGNKHEHKYTYTSNDNGTHNGVCACGTNVTNEACTYDNNGSCTKCKGKQSIVANLTFTSDSKAASALTIVGGKDINIAAVVAVTPTTWKASDFTWDSTDPSIVTVTKKDNNGNAVIKGLKNGKTTIKCVATLNNPAKTTVQNTIEVTVSKSTITLDRTAKKALFVGGETFTLTATVKGGVKNQVTWTSSDSSIAELGTPVEKEATEGKTSAVVITGKKEGTATITATNVDDNTVVASLTVVVAKHPKDDTVTKLVDKNGKQVFVYDSASKTYKEATYADYYKGVDLFTAADVVYTYTGWWTIDGKTYYFDKNGKKVTGDQVILGAQYSFSSEGVLKSGTGLFGIDVSKWNGTIDWNKVAKSGVSYAIIRCGFRGTTVGGLVSDEKFATNIKNATDAGIKVGVYFFTQAISEAEAVEEASMCLSMIEGYKVSYPIFIDVENAAGGRANNLSKEQRTDVIKAFCKTISNAGYKAGVYANKNWFTNYMNASELTSYTIWLAQYAASPTYTTTRYDVWQYSSQGSINGISGDVDLDLSYLGY